MDALSTLTSLVFSTFLVAGEPSSSSDCSSIARILVNPETCDSREVRLEGKVSKLTSRTSKLGTPYTEFTLAQDSKRLRFFSYDHVLLEEGMCARVIGTYWRQRPVGGSFKSEVVVDKGAEGIAKVPCPPEVRRQETRNLTKKSIARPRWVAWKEGIVFLIVAFLVLVPVLWTMLGPARSRRKGRSFEDFVIGLFPDAEWEIEDRSSDTSHRIRRRVTGDVSYDCIVKHRATFRRFIIQCKYRTRFYRQGGREGIEWAKPYQIRNYGEFQRQKKWPYLVIIGVGGSPKRPEQLFVLSLARLHDPFIAKHELLVAKRDANTPFTIDGRGALG